jgi:DNA-binding MarR family transcriptional regulator
MRNKSSSQERDLHQALDKLSLELALVFFRLRNAARDLLGEGKHSSGRRSVLKSLGRDGAQTVPQMARERAVSRQHVQKLVDGLKASGLVSLAENPLHKRSKLVTLSDEGRRFLEEMNQREEKLKAFLSEGVPLEEMNAALRVVGQLRHRLDSEEWQTLLDESR